MFYILVIDHTDGDRRETTFVDEAQSLAAWDRAAKLKSTYSATLWAPHKDRSLTKMRDFDRGELELAD